MKSKFGEQSYGGLKLRGFLGTTPMPNELEGQLVFLSKVCLREFSSTTTSMVLPNLLEYYEEGWFPPHSLMFW